jgi:hypothetical protein
MILLSGKWKQSVHLLDEEIHLSRHGGWIKGMENDSLSFFLLNPVAALMKEKMGKAEKHKKR